jgi:hypothetical protein
MAETTDVSAKLWKELSRRWPKSKCTKDVVSVSRWKTKVDGSTEIIEIEHLHYTSPHIRYFRLTMRDGKITEVCDAQAKLLGP